MEGKKKKEKEQSPSWFAANLRKCFRILRKKDGYSSLFDVYVSYRRL